MQTLHSLRRIVTMTVATLGLLALNACASMNHHQAVNVDQQIPTKVVYFTEAGGLTTDQDKAAYLRKIYPERISSDAPTRYIFQDFFITGEKQSDPTAITDPDELNKWDQASFEGPFQIYHRNGTIAERSTIHQGKPVGRAESFNEQGQKLTQSEFSKTGELIKHQSWFDNGQLASVLDAKKQTAKQYYPSGVLRAESHRKEVNQASESYLKVYTPEGAIASDVTMRNDALVLIQLYDRSGTNYQVEPMDERIRFHELPSNVQQDLESAAEILQSVLSELSIN